jgi:hypothetical protein
VASWGGWGEGGGGGVRWVTQQHNPLGGRERERERGRKRREGASLFEGSAGREIKGTKVRELDRDELSRLDYKFDF